MHSGYAVNHSKFGIRRAGCAHPSGRLFKNGTYNPTTTPEKP
jgi:hypothetical protein